MFNADFYPTKRETIELMSEGIQIAGRVFLEPEAGKGDIVDYLKEQGAADVIACEKNKDLAKIVSGKCKVIASDFLTVKSEQISHIDGIFMNPPFSADEKHILHAWNIAPAGCEIVSLCNLKTVTRLINKSRQELDTIITTYGSYEDIGSCFGDAERETDVEIALVRLRKPGVNNDEFEGFYMDEEPEEKGENGIMSYNVVRDLVQRYIATIKLFDKQMELALEMNDLMGEFYSSGIAMTCTEEGKPKTRNEFKKDLQKSAWKYIFDKLNMEKYATRGLRDDINKFVEKQTKIPFTMRNIYHMLQLIVGTQSQRMDKALLEVFDKLTQHYDENRYNVEGWKTNSHYLINQKFIMPRMVEAGWAGSGGMRSSSYSNFDTIEDFVKALCYITGDNYDHFISLNNYINYEYKLIDKVTGRTIDYSHRYEDMVSKQKGCYEEGKPAEIKRIKCEFGQWYEWSYFRFKGFKKGTMHMEFKDADLWGKFNQHIAKLKGYPLYESVKQTKKEKRHTRTA
jgi:hypothetical protein